VVISHAHRRDGGTEDATRRRRGRSGEPSQLLARSAAPTSVKGRGGQRSFRSRPPCPEMMFVPGPVLEASANLPHGAEVAGGVVLGDIDEGDACGQSDDPAARRSRTQVAIAVVAGRGAGVHHLAGNECQRNRG